MGVTVREKVKGSKVYWLFISHDRKRVSRRVGDKRAAELAATQIRAKLILGDLSVLEPVAPPPPVVAPLTFGEFAEKWLREVPALRRLRHGTVMIYTSAVERHLAPMLGERPLATLTGQDVERFIL